MNSLLRGGISYHVFESDISNVHFHVSQLGDFFLSFVLKIFITDLDLLLVLYDNCLCGRLLNKLTCGYKDIFL